MPTPAERQALLFIATVAALGIGVRACRAAGSGTSDPSAREALASQIAAVDSAIATGGARKSARSPVAPRAPRVARSARNPSVLPAPSPSRATEPARAPAPRIGPRSPVDVDVADSAALEALPGIGPALAARIIADRRERGPFGSLEALQQVKGIGPALSAKLAPVVTFSSPPRLPLMGRAGAHRERRP